MTQHQRDRHVTRNDARAAWLLLSAAVLTSQVARADEPQRCAEIADDRARLACYDSLFGKPGAPAPVSAPAAAEPVSASAAAGTDAATPTVAGTAKSASATVVAAGSVPAGGATNPEADFGLTEAAKRAREPEESREKLPESISGTVAKIGRQPAGELIVTLDNGQVWTQVQVDARARIAVGDTVTIKKAALGSHLLVTASRYATRVRRVK